uniref:Receptor-like serine/threonine-protein kinase n=1 Tax=Cajanus cajan TaxID=3821 RepID=A0A151QYZ7_CAJCA|nr:Putative serine/threonine-protein kinase receptor [Cajanus cajan]
MHLWLWWSTCFHVKANNSLRPGDTLNYTETGKVITKNGKYFLAFYTIVDDTYLAVWKTNWDTYWVWLSDRNQPVDPDSAVLSLNHSGVLKIESQRGKPIILYSPPQPINNTVATLLDTGNFVLQQLHPNGSTMSVLWQSFDYPIDTMIPTMKLGVNHKTGHNWSLVSYFANDDINIVTPGAFSLEWEPVGEELVIRRRGKVSWRSGKLRNNRFEHISEDAQRTLNYTVVSNADESSFSFTTTNDDVDVLWWIASDGQLNNYSETVVWADMCYGYNTDEGCQRWEDIPECRSRGDVYQRKTGHLNFEYAISEPNMSYGLSDCQAMCWSNCSCTGYKEHNHNGTGCTFFSSGPYYTLSDVGERFYMLGNVTQQIDKSTAKSEPPGTKKFIWISALIATILLIICLFSVCLILKKRKYMFQGTSSRKEFEDDLKHGLELKAFTYISIMEATDGFSSENKLGQGGFGPVYKGIFSTGQEVAIKRLSKSSTQGIVEFKNELKLICELQHMNLVQLLGYCIHEEERILLYEYMPNKSLDFFIFDCTRRKLLDWKKRFNIIEGIAQGLLYLHKYSRLKVIHRDLKASNILLDENWNPKISDFGMARIFTQQEPVENTNRVVGTYGYMSPEYAMEGIFSTKSDVYSFGVLLLEIISGRRNTSFYDDDHPLNLIGHAWELWNVGEPLQLVDQSLNESFEPDEVQRCIHVGLLCVEQYTNDRPTMFDILSMLTNKSAIVSLPQRPAFYVKREISNRSLSSKELLTDSTFEITTSGKMESR